MDLKKNVLASYASQIYVTLIGIIVVPLYIERMGAEAYGLVGFFAMLQAWFTLLDMGLTPTMARETSRFRGGAVTALNYRQLVRALEGVFVAVAVVGGLGMFAASRIIATDWLNASRLPVVEMQTAIRAMALIIAMRWMCGLYRGAVTGSERLVWLGWFSASIATIRFLGVLPALTYMGSSPTVFFGFQLVVAIVELAWLSTKAYSLLPSIPSGDRVRWSWEPLRPVLMFSLTIAFTSAAAVLVTQTDKLVLSKVLSLADYGRFTLAVLIASGVMVISGPISAAIMPRLSKLEAERDYVGLMQVYHRATQFVAVIAGAATITVAFFAEPLLWAWTGDRALAHQSATILALYATGNGVLAVSAFPYFLQYAKGNLRMHVIGNALFVVALIPTIIWAATRYGGVGAGVVWLCMNSLAFIAWLPLVHRKFAPGVNKRWYGEDIAAVVVPGAISGYLLNRVMPLASTRHLELFEICVVGTVVLTVSALSSSSVREAITAWSARRRQMSGPVKV